jgi:type II secretory pathway component PulJ
MNMSNTRHESSRYGVRRQSEAATAHWISAGGTGGKPKRCRRFALPPQSITRGFTLIEVVLAIFLAIGILLVLLFFYQQAANLRAELVSEAERLSTVRLVMDRITSELRTARAHAFYEGVFLGDSQFLQFIKTDDIPRSAWRSGERVARAVTDLKLVRYSAQSHAEGTNTAVAAFYRTEEPLIESRRARATVSVAPVEDSPGQRDEPLSEAIRFVRFRYWDGSAWLESWDGVGIPAGVEITLGFEAPSVEEGAAALPDEVFRRVVYLPGSAAKHPEFKVFQKLSDITHQEEEL